MDDLKHLIQSVLRPSQIALLEPDHTDVVEGGCFAGAIADLPRDGQGVLVVGQGLLPATQPGVHEADVAEGARSGSPSGSRTSPMLLRVVASPARSPTSRRMGRACWK